MKPSIGSCRSKDGDKEFKAGSMVRQGVGQCMVSYALEGKTQDENAQKRDVLSFCRKEPRNSPGQRRATWGMGDSPGDGVAHDARGAQRSKRLLDGRG